MTGRTLYDLLSELFARYGSWLIPAIIALAILVVAWVHYQTPPGEEVKFLGVGLYRKASEESPTFEKWWNRK
jgi:hypothetical protein